MGAVTGDPKILLAFPPRGLKQTYKDTFLIKQGTWLECIRCQLFFLELSARNLSSELSAILRETFCYFGRTGYNG